MNNRELFIIKKLSKFNYTDWHKVDKYKKFCDNMKAIDKILSIRKTLYHKEEYFGNQL